MRVDVRGGPGGSAAPLSGLLALCLAALLGAGCAGRTPEAEPGPGAEPEAAPGAPEAEIGPEERPEPVPPDRYYWAYVASDGPDIVSRLRFGPGGVAHERSISVGSVPGRPDGIRELAVSPDGSHWFLAVGGAAAPGRVWKYETGSDRGAGQLRLRGTPDGLGVTPDGTRIFVTAGPPDGTGPATVAVVRTGALTEAARMATCRGGRSSGLHPDGRWQYSVCRIDDLLVEVSVEESRVTRTVRLSADGGESCGPVDLALSPDGERLHVACGSGGELLVLDRDDLEIRRRVRLEGRPASVDVIPGDGRVLVLVEEEPALLLLGPDGDGPSARIPLSDSRPSSLAVSDDGRYAFVALRGRPGAPRSTVEVVDLRAMVGVATIEVPEGATSAAFWRSVAEER